MRRTAKRRISNCSTDEDSREEDSGQEDDIKENNRKEDVKEGTRIAMRGGQQRG